MDPRGACSPSLQDDRDRARGRRGLRPQAPDVEQRRRDLARAAVRVDGLLLPERRGRRGLLRPRGVGDAAHDVRRPVLQGGRLRRHPARDDLHLRAVRPAAVPALRDARADRDPEAVPEPVRAADGARALLPPGHPPADRAPDRPRARRVPAQDPRPGRLPGLRDRLPPVRRRGLGRLPLPVDVQHQRLRADHGAHPHAAAVASDVLRAPTSSSARSARESWTSTRWRFRSRTTTRTSRARR